MKKKIKEKLQFVADNLKQVYRLIWYAFLIFIVLLIIPTVWMFAQIGQGVTDFLNDVKTEKNINFIGTLLSDEAVEHIVARSTASGCDIRNVFLDISYDVVNANMENENLDENTKNSKLLLKGNNQSNNEETKDTLKKLRDFVRSDNGTTSFKLTLKYDSKGCYSKKNVQDNNSRV